MEHALPIGLPGLVVERKLSVSYGGHCLPTKFDALVSGGGGGSGRLDLPVRPVLRHSFSPSVGEEPQVSLPERPYLGMGCFINEWQCKTVDVELLRSPISQCRGGGGGGMGATASLQHAGVIMGHGGQD